MLASFLHFCDYHDACALFHQLQVGVLSCLVDNELGSLTKSVRMIVQKFSLFMSNWESTISTDWSDFSSTLGGCRAVYHFPNITSNYSHFAHYDFHRATSLFLDFCQTSEAPQHALMAMVVPHCLDMTDDNDQVYLSISYSHHDPLSQIKNPSSQRSLIFQNIHHEFYDPIVEWLEQSYLASHVAGNKIQSFLALHKKLGAEQHTLARGLQGLLKNGSHERGKHVCWVVVTHSSAHRRDLLSHVQVFQVFSFSIAHYFLYVLIIGIFVTVGRVHLWWLH